MELLVNIFYTTVLYLLLGYGMKVTYASSKFFNLSIAAIVCICPYIFISLSNYLSNIIWLFIISIVVTLLIGFVVFALIKLFVGFENSFVLLIISLGIFIILQNTISLIWGDSTLKYELTNNFLFQINNLSSVRTLTIIVGILLFLISIIMEKNSFYGIKLRSMQSNSSLVQNFGISPNKILFLSYFQALIILSTIVFFIFLDVGIRPIMGFKYVLLGIVTMIIGGTGRSMGLLFGALLLASAQHMGAYFISSNWMDAIAYIILILFLIFKPLGFSGKQLKKVEI